MCLKREKIDGAGHIQCFIYIVCPQLVEYFISILILCVINGFKIYRQIYLLTGDYPNEGIYMLQNLFNNWFRNLKLADMSAAAILILIPVIILVLFVDKIRIGVRK
ncbi:MAG: ABC transporter permease subunit [Christensenellales bacterium]